MLAGGCYAPQLPEGAPCAANGACPAPLACSAGHCVAGIVHDAQIDGSAIGSDGPPACTPILVGSGALTAPTTSPSAAERTPHAPPKPGETREMAIKDLGNFDYDADKAEIFPLMSPRFPA